MQTPHLGNQELMPRRESKPGQYYYTLKEYSPLFYFGKGAPFFMIHRNYCASLPCLICMNAVFILAMVVALIMTRNSNKAEFQIMLSKIYMLTLFLIDLTGFLTITMNPGIISQEDLQIKDDAEVRFCKVCMRKKVDMTHCNECDVCVQDLDHHCGFFGKCIAGRQRFAFYALLLFMFCGFLVLMVGISSNLG